MYHTANFEIKSNIDSTPIPAIPKSKLVGKKDNKKYNFVDLFAGAGGFTIGFNRLE